jgi:hypothetical protein
MQKRDINIVKSLNREINMQQRTVKDKTKYTRKEKHKNI